LHRNKSKGKKFWGKKPKREKKKKQSSVIKKGQMNLRKENKKNKYTPIFLSLNERKSRKSQIV
jgi:hypothetical protein